VERPVATRRAQKTVNDYRISDHLMLQGVEAVTTLRVSWIGDEPYLDSSTVEHKPLGSSP